MSVDTHENSSGEPRKKHRHDLGQEDHGPKLAAGTTRGIQILLGTWVTLTIALVLYAVLDGITGGVVGSDQSTRRNHDDNSITTTTNAAPSASTHAR